MSEAATRVFISFSLPKSGPSRMGLFKWVGELRDYILDKAGYRKEHIYFYPDAARGDDIREDISTQIASAEHLVCVVSNDYLSSTWCLDEMYRFAERADERRSNPIYVFSPFLDKTPFQDKDKFANDIRLGIQSMEDAKGPLFTPDLRKWAFDYWMPNLEAALTTKRDRIDFRSTPWDPVSEKLFVEALTPPRSRSLWDYASIAAYCIGADRYKTGGWGFSLEQLSSSDETEEEISHGACGTNLVVLNALSQFSDKKTVKPELLAIFSDLLTNKRERFRRNAFRATTDRLPYFAGLLACLQSPEFVGEVICLYAQAAHDSLAGVAATSRWTLAQLQRDPKDRDPKEKEYHTAALACLSHVKEIRDDAALASSWSLIFENAKLENDLQYLNDFIHCVSDALGDEKNNLLQLLCEGVGRYGSPQYNLAARICTMWLVLANCQDGRILLAQHISSSLRQKAVKDSLERVTRDAIARFDPAVVSLVLTALSAATTCFESLPQVLGKIWKNLWEDLFPRVESYVAVPKLSAVAWASIILFAASKEGGAPNGEKKTWQEMFERGRKLREARLQAVLDLTKNHERLKMELEDRTQSILETDAAWWTEHAAIYVRGSGESREEHQYKFVEAMKPGRGAKFWGGETPIAEGPGQPRLGGFLRVNMSTRRVEMDSPGYRHIFLYPFSCITGMHVLDLDGIRREFGDDTELVKLMGKTVVASVFVPSPKGDGYTREKCNFEERTNNVMNELENSWKMDEPQMSMDDLLVVRRGLGEDTRWIHRSAIIQPARRASDELVISWRFVEMLSVVERLVVQ